MRNERPPRGPADLFGSTEMPRALMAAGCKEIAAAAREFSTRARRDADGLVGTTARYELDCAVEAAERYAAAVERVARRLGEG